MQTVIYALVIPICVVFAFKRTPIANPYWNTLLWAAPFMTAQYVLFSDSASGMTLAAALAGMFVVFCASVFVARVVETWLQNRFGSG